MPFYFIFGTAEELSKMYSWKTKFVKHYEVQTQKITGLYQALSSSFVILQPGNGTGSRPALFG